MVNVTELVLAAVMSISWPENAIVYDGLAFDFIIIGSGAGSVLANRLTERSDFNVLMIEAGGDPSDATRIAPQFPTVTNSPMDWNFTTEVEPTSISQETGTFKVSSGKVLGGSSAINHLLNIRGVPEDFNYIADLLGDPSWKYENMLPYFKKSENFKDAAIMDSNYNIFHGSEGPVNLTRQIHNVSTEYINAFAELGYASNPDINSNNLTGYGDIPYMIDLVRQDTAGTYLLSARNRTNLHVLKNAFVTKINIVDSVATGVQLVYNNTNITLNANKEVLVCGGVINSPALLMRSGIGPQDLLEKYDIPVIVDAPVGSNLQEHVAVPIVHKLDYSTAEAASTDLDQIFPIFLGSVVVDEDKTVPQYQTTNLWLEHDSANLMGACSTIFGLKTDTCNMFVNETAGRNTLFTLVAIYNPDSRGLVEIQSADPYVYPKIKYNFYENTTDFTNMVRYIADFLRINGSTLFQDVGAEVVLPELSDCTASYWECYVNAYTVNMFHPTSTCPIGTVLDCNANVKGVKGLRVVDASSLPKIPTANPLAAIIAVAEKIADVIKNDNPSS